MISSDTSGLPVAALAGATALPPGTVLDGYRLDTMIAQGGFGQVYRATAVADGRAVALKILHGELCSAPSAVARFLREAEVMMRVRHPNVVELVAWGTVADGRPYLAMELLAGTDLARVLSASGRMPLARVLEIVAPTCAALAAAHAQNIVHRDLKASNVFLARGADGHERVVLIDFGIAKLAVPEATELTTSRQLVGTPVTMAPEQIAGGTVDARTDVYGLGVMTFHLLTGRLPFEDESATIVQYLHAHARRPRASAFAPVPPAVDDVLMRAMAIDPGQRFADAPAFVAALRAAIEVPADPSAALEPRPAVAILIEVRASDDTMADPDDAVLTDLEGLLPLAERALADAGQTAALAQLREEIRQLSAPGRAHNLSIGGSAQVGTAIAGDVHGNITSTQQSGGVNFGSGNTFGQMGDVVAGDKAAGDKVAGDKIVHYGAPRPADTGPEHTRAQIDTLTRRLRVLEQQAALFGYNVRPEVTMEIEDLQRTIARLQALLDG